MNIRQAVSEDVSGIARVKVDSWRTTYRDIVPDDFVYNQLTYQRREKRWKETLEAEKPMGISPVYSMSDREYRHWY